MQPITLIDTNKAFFRFEMVVRTNKTMADTPRRAATGATKAAEIIERTDWGQGNCDWRQSEVALRPSTRSGTSRATADASGRRQGLSTESTEATRSSRIDDHAIRSVRSIRSIRSPCPCSRLAPGTAVKETSVNLKPAVDPFHSL